MKPKSFLSHPLPECSCTTVKTADLTRLQKRIFQGQDECPQGLEHPQTVVSQETSSDDTETPEEDIDIDVVELVENSQAESVPSGEQDDEMDPDD